MPRGSRSRDYNEKLELLEVSEIRIHVGAKYQGSAPLVTFLEDRNFWRSSMSQEWGESHAHRLGVAR